MLRLQYANWSGAEYRTALAALLTGRVTSGPAVARLEQEIGAAYELPVHAVNSGRTAIMLALAAFRQQRPDRNSVVVPAYVCPSVIDLVRESGLTPVPVDVADDLNLDPAALEPLLQARAHDVLAVIAPHMYGSPCRIEAIEALCRRFDVMLVDDAAQVVSVRQSGRLLGSFGDVGVVSFAQSKAIVTGVGGSGGLLMVNRPEWRDALAKAVTALPPAAGRAAYWLHFLWEYLWTSWTKGSGYYFSRVGARLGWSLVRHHRARIANLDAALARVQWHRLDGILAERVRLAQLYDQALRDLPQVVFNQFQPGRFLSRVMVALPEGTAVARVAQALAAAGVQTRRAYPVPADWRDKAPRATYWADRLLELPSPMAMDAGQASAVVRALKSALAAQPSAL